MIITTNIINSAVNYHAFILTLGNRGLLLYTQYYVGILQVYCYGLVYYFLDFGY